MAAPRRDSIGCLIMCLIWLALAEAAVITLLLQPYPSTQNDWLVGTLMIAPLAAFITLWTAALTARIILDTATLIGRLTRWTRAN